MGCTPPGVLVASEEYAWSMLSNLNAESMKAEFNREVGKRILELTGKDVEFEHPDVVVYFDIGGGKVEVQPRAVFVKGRYRKLIRGIPQTRWPCRHCKGKGCEKCGYTGKQYAESVDELISAPVLKVFDAEDTAFHGAGREDIDARMLGKGRPFVIEAKLPRKRKTDLMKLEEEINQHAKGKVEVIGLEYATKEDVHHIKEMTPLKRYLATVDFKERVEEEELKAALEGLEGQTIVQRTPLRVLHRRSDLARERRVTMTEL